MNMTISSSQTTAATLTDQQVASYQKNGFIHLPQVLTPEQVEQFYQPALDVAKRLEQKCDNDIFSQTVNVWQQDATLAKLTLDANLAAIAQKLAGIKLRLWHDHLLIKWPHSKANTEFHQDQPYWPHRDSRPSLSAWIALCDIPVERGCMSFIPGTQQERDLPVQRLEDPRSLMEICPAMEWMPRVTLPLKAGDCTFHDGRCAHMAGNNRTNDPRVAHVLIYMDVDTCFDADIPHCVTDPIASELTDRQVLDHQIFPTLDRIIDGSVNPE